MTATNMCSNFGGLWYSPPLLNCRMDNNLDIQLQIYFSMLGLECFLAIIRKELNVRARMLSSRHQEETQC